MGIMPVRVGVANQRRLITWPEHDAVLGGPTCMHHGMLETFLNFGVGDGGALGAHTDRIRKVRTNPCRHCKHKLAEHALKAGNASSVGRAPSALAFSHASSRPGRHGVGVAR